MRELIVGLAVLASVIAGEAPAGCPFEAKVAVSWVYANRIEAGIPDQLYGGDPAGGWFGWAVPGLDDWEAARWWWSLNDPTDGALYMIGPGDGELMPWLRRRTGRWDCDGTWLESWQ